MATINIGSGIGAGVGSLVPGIGTAIGGFIGNLVGSLFGDKRVKLTLADWEKAIPGNGKWTAKLRNHFFNTIHYDVDVGNVPDFTESFVYDNITSLSGGKYQTYSATANNIPDGVWQSEIMPGFNSLLALEKEGYTPKNIYDLDISKNSSVGSLGSSLSSLVSGKTSPLLLLGGVGLAFVLFRKGLKA